MKNYLKTAVIIASLLIGLTACTDTEKTNLLAEIEKAKPEFVAIDSTLTNMQQFVMQRKDSLLQVANNDPKQKNAIDSMITADQKDVNELDSVAAKHKAQTLQVDSLTEQLASDKLKTGEAKTKWESLKGEHQAAKEYADKASMGLLLLFMAEKTQNDTAK
jgi:hypothetical protein